MQLSFKPSFLQVTPSDDLTRHLRACAGGLGQIVPDPVLLFVDFLSSNGWRKCVNSAFRKTPLFKNCRSERLSGRARYLQGRNLHTSFYSLVDFGLPFLPCSSQSCHFCTQCCYSYILLKETKRSVHKNSFMENFPVQS